MGGAKNRPEPNTLRAAGATGSRVSSGSLGNFWSRERNVGLVVAARVGEMGRGLADSPKPEGSGGEMKLPKGAIPGRAQVLAAYVVKPGRLTSLARRILICVQGFK